MGKSTRLRFHQCRRPGERNGPLDRRDQPTQLSDSKWLGQEHTTARNENLRRGISRQNGTNKIRQYVHHPDGEWKDHADTSRQLDGGRTSSEQCPTASNPVHREVLLFKPGFALVHSQYCDSIRQTLLSLFVFCDTCAPRIPVTYIVRQRTESSLGYLITI